MGQSKHGVLEDPERVAVIRSYEDADFDMLAEIRRDPLMNAMLLTVVERTDDAAVREWIERRQTEPGGLFRIVADRHTGTGVGFIQIGQVHRKNGVGYGGLAVTPRFHGHGYGRAAITALVRLGRDELGLRKLMAEIRSDNIASIELHLAAGYRAIGVFSQHFLDATGSAHDVLLVEQLL
ncbi:MAG: GNAT family protein [Hoeflea sp.]|uniref:GNAT family N-acetyltransferase n=1 Tax=Hoeflea sp. TaxID=1940281 RepID=UPI00272FF9F9|nr:GNAT family protein [Hoeflea sp.]MDP2122614.1 GNAT family protein [Hoeflea sp.]MDP3524749.1 GNAT family protein [Hoeflea sp.]